MHTTQATQLAQRIADFHRIFGPAESVTKPLFAGHTRVYICAMAETNHQRLGEHLIKLFTILKKHPEGLQAGQALGQLALMTTLSPYEEGEYASGTRRFEKIIRFATVGATKAGWLLKNKGIWSLTDAGLKALQDHRDPEKFYNEMVRLYYAWRKSQPAKEIPAEKDDLAGEEATVTFEQAQEQAWGEIETYLGNMPPYEFQDLVADLVKATGYHITWVAPPGKDGGVDIIAHPDALGVQSPRMKVQVKRLADRLPIEPVRAFAATLKNEEVGLLVCLGGFTRDAEEYARLHSNSQMNIIDLQRLVELWAKYYDKLDDQARRRFSLTPIYFLTPSE
jgi:restriction system protein